MCLSFEQINPIRNGRNMLEKYDAIPHYDLVIIGGGINGTGIAADASGRGLRVLLCEKDDLAQHTSSASSKLIHGGLRYLEHKEFRLVRESLAEREVLLSKAPHLVRPMRFIMPHQPHLRPAWLIRTGLFLYDHLAKRKQLVGSNSVRFSPINSPLKKEITRGFEYSDCCVDDARLVVLNALQAKEKGADILTQTTCISAYREQDDWRVRLKNNTDTEFEVKAKALVNAAGPWVEQVIQQQLQLKSPHQLRLIQGSHIIVRKVYPDEHAFIFQNADQRIVFAIPYLDQYTLIGTTDREYLDDPQDVQIHADEVEYLLDISNQYFRTQLTHSDIISSFSGVRALPDDDHEQASAITRDYRLTLSVDERKQLPLLCVFGGKLTTYRKLAESALAQLQFFFPHLGEAWTADSPLPGAEQWRSVEDLIIQIRQQVVDIPVKLARRWATSYGMRVWQLLHGAESLAQLGQLIAHDLYAAEVDYLLEYEWAKSGQDILWRRTKLGLQFQPQDIEHLERYLASMSLDQAQPAIA